MKQRIMLFALVLCLPNLLVRVADAQEKEKKADPKAAAMDEMMKKMIELATPGAPHKKLAELAGTWDATTSMTMEPGASPSVTKGSATYRTVLDGRFLMEEFKGEMMGMPMTGMGFFGYDNINKKYTMMWIDNFGTVMSTAEGSADQTGKVISLYGTMDDPTTGEHDKNVKYVYRLVDKDKHIFEIHDLAIGETNTKVVEVVYTRKK